MKKLMISIHPTHLTNILNLIKKSEVRGWKPKGELPLEVLIYVAKREPYLAYDGGCYDDSWGMSKSFYGYQLFDTKCELNSRDDDFVKNCPPLNGKVVAKFILKKVDTYYVEGDLIWRLKNKNIETSHQIVKNICDDSCLTKEELMKMAKPISDKQKIFHAWEIDDLEIFDEPKILSDYGLTKAPQKMVWLKEQL